MESIDVPPAVAYHLSESERSHRDIENLVYTALRSTSPAPYECWIREIYDDHIIYEEHLPSAGGIVLFKRPYVIAGDDAVTFGEAVKVTEQKTYVPLAEALSGGALMEAADADGWKWHIQIIQSGTSINGNEYPLAVLHEAAAAYAGVPVFYGTGPDHNPNERGVGSLAGAITEAVGNAAGLAGTFEINPGRPDVRETIRLAYTVKQKTQRDVMGFSHVVPADGCMVEARKPRGYRVKKISKVDSVDLVMRPSAGGALLSPLAESRETFVPDPLQEAIVNVAELLAKLREGKKLSLEELAFLQESLGGNDFAAALAEAGKPPATTPPVTEATPAPAISEAEARIQTMLAEAEAREKRAICRATLTEALAEAKLPKPFKDAIAADFDARIFEADELTKRIERDVALAESMGPSRVRPHGLGLGNTPITEDQREKHQKAMDGLVWGQRQDGVTPFLTLKEAYQAITGDYSHSYIDGDLPRRVLAEMIAYAGDDALVKEAITSSTFGDILGDSIRRRMLAVYARPDRQTWRRIARIEPVIDFRTVERERMGGYGFLPEVNEGAPYQPLDTPGEEKATDSLDKYGGLESVTMETIANDDMGVIRRIPTLLGFAAVDTLYDAVWNGTIKDNAVASYDSTALYHNNHANTGTAALDEAGLAAIRVAMRSQTEFGNATALPMGEAATPRIIAVPNELEIAAFKLVRSAVAITSGADATIPNFFNNGLDVIVVDSWTDANNWYAFADPDLVPTLEVGFFQGREEPELFVQDAQNVGSMFTADKVTYKIRHIWYVMPLEHRGTYRQVVT